MKLKYVTPDLEINGSVAVVIPSAKLLEKENGSLIDSFDNVFRFNHFQTVGYENWSGSKTDYIYSSYKQYRGGYKSIATDPREARFDCNFEYRSEFLAFQIMAREKYGLPLFHQPSSGFLCVVSLVESGITPTVFGFDPDPINYSYYFTDEVYQRVIVENDHNFTLEKFIVSKLSDSRKIILK